MTLIQGRVAALLAELDAEFSRVLEKHFTEDEKAGSVLHHYGPLSIQIHGADGHLASFLEDGIDIYPKGGRGVAA